MAFEHILVVRGRREKEERLDELAVCSFKPPFEDDACHSHVSAPVYGGYAFLFIHPLAVLVHVCVCVCPFCLCVCVCL